MCQDVILLTIGGINPKHVPFLCTYWILEEEYRWHQYTFYAMKLINLSKNI